MAAAADQRWRAAHKAAILRTPFDDARIFRGTHPRYHVILLMLMVLSVPRPSEFTLNSGATKSVATIGAGGMGEVFRARDTSPGETPSHSHFRVGQDGARRYRGFATLTLANQGLDLIGEQRRHQATALRREVQRVDEVGPVAGGRDVLAGAAEDSHVEQGNGKALGHRRFHF